MSIITSAEFVVSNTDYRKCPSDQKPEFAFIGRSNVGKSSLINMLTQRKGLAKTSAKPGKTQLINHFLINEQWYLVDLPGYGYASVSKTQRKAWANFIEDYILNRPTLVSLFVLIDSRLPMQRIDEEFINWLGEHRIPFVIVFTKTDKLGSTKLANHITAYKKELARSWEILPQSFISSAEKQVGRDDILAYIQSLIQ